MRKSKKTLSSLCIPLLLSISSCAHQSTIEPSTGHIDGKNTAPNQPVAKSAAAIPKPVTNSAYLPPPKSKTKEPVYSIVVYDTPVKEVLFAIARDSKLNVDIHPSIQGRVTLNAVDQTLPAILERLSKQVDLTYKIQGNVLSITPDQPVLRAYKVDYVNMSRDTKGYIGVDGQISSSSQSTGANGTVSSSSGNGANNSSSTSINSESKSHFWETLERNIAEILAETDKEVIITRTGTGEPLSTVIQKAGAADASQAAVTEAKNAALVREQMRKEYKTLFAATVISNREAGMISVRGTNKQHEKVQEFLDKVLNSAKRQVLIEATIVEVKLNDGFQSGVDWSRLGANGFILSQGLGPQLATLTAAKGANVVVGRTSPGIVAGYANANHGILGSVQLLKQFGDTKVLSSPKLMVLNNQTAVLKVVDNLVYFTLQVQDNLVANAGSSKTITTTPNTVPIGVVMSVTPQISDSGVVNINVRPTITSLIRYVPDPNPQVAGNQGIPEIRTREMESMLQINSGNTAILGGLMQDDIKSNTEKVPGLSGIPVVGKVFTGRNDSNVKTELVIFLRPTVIGNASLESDELATYKQYLPSQQWDKKLDAESAR